MREIKIQLKLDDERLCTGCHLRSGRECMAFVTRTRFRRVLSIDRRTGDYLRLPQCIEAEVRDV